MNSSGDPAPATSRLPTARGRFAPTPSGPLHFGSLVTAVGSYLQARRAGGQWLVRIEDLDTPRVVPGTADAILRVLEALGFEWDEPVEYQSRRIPLYADAFERLKNLGRVYPCSCTRSQLTVLDDQRYPGTCRGGVLRPHEPHAWRFSIDSGEISFSDRLQGPYAQNVAATCGDFIVKRRDGIFAYHLAVVVDDAAQGITEVARGADLLDSTPRQICLQRALGLPTPAYAHLPLAVDAAGHKLSKSTQSLPIDPTHGTELLWHALAFLRQSPPRELAAAPLKALWSWALETWSLDPLRQIKSGRAP